jgi:hypothetical protein
MKTFKQHLLESMEKERELRKKAGIDTPESKSDYLSRGHDSEDYDPSFFDKGHREKVAEIMRKAWNVEPGQEFKLPDLWASGPTIKLNMHHTDEKHIGVRPLEHMGQTHTDVFPDAYEHDNEGFATRSKPHVYGRIDHVRKQITMKTDHPRYFSSGSLDKMHRELNQRYPNYDVVDTISKERG